MNPISLRLNREERLASVKQRVRRSSFAREMYAMGGIRRVLNDARHRIGLRVKEQENVLRKVGMVYNGKVLEMRRLREKMMARNRLGLEVGVWYKETYDRMLEETRELEKELAKQRESMTKYEETAQRFDFLFDQWMLIAADAKETAKKYIVPRNGSLVFGKQLIEYENDFEMMGETMIDLDVPSRMYVEEARRIQEEDEKVEREDLDERK